MKAKINYKENVEYVLRDKDGKVKKLFQENALYRFFLNLGLRLPQIPLLFGKNTEIKVIANLITSVGKAALASRVNGSGGEAAFTYIAIGTGTTAANIADTALQAEITTNGGQRASGAVSRTTTTVTNDTAKITNTFTFTGSFAVTESGLLNAASTGVLGARQVFSAINVVANDTLAITWNLSNS